jgi:predicted Zn-dependent protease
MMKRCALAVMLLVLTACEGPFIPATLVSEIYPFNLETTPSRIFRWQAGSRIRVFAAADSPDRGALLQQALSPAVRAWNERALYDDYQLVPVASLQDADVLLRWSDEPAPVDMSECEPVLSLAVTTFCLRADDATKLATFPFLHTGIGESRVRIVVTVLGAAASDAQLTLRLVSHELGHVLGIGRHSDNAQDLMFGGVLTRSTLSARDAATVQTLYRTKPDITP